MVHGNVQLQPTCAHHHDVVLSLTSISMLANRIIPFGLFWGSGALPLRASGRHDWSFLKGIPSPTVSISLGWGGLN